MNGKRTTFLYPYVVKELLMRFFCACRHANDHLVDEELSRDLQLAHEMAFQLSTTSSFTVISETIRFLFWV